MKSGGKLLIGIDEAGRGPIAGPVAVGAFAFLTPNARRLFRGVKESKQLSEKKRERWFILIQEAKKNGHINFRVSFQSHKIIDTKGISHAIRMALAKSLNGLKIKPVNARILLDGGLKAPLRYKNQRTIIKGDEKEVVIALASICAKVLRDRYMRELSSEHPQYGFDIHKGYGTQRHYQAIKKHGISPMHRQSFLKRMK
jgi:ribonuclease HII